MDATDAAAMHPGLRGLDEPVALMAGAPPTVVWKTGDPSSAPLPEEGGGHALERAADDLDEVIFGAMIHA